MPPPSWAEWILDRCLLQPTTWILRSLDGRTFFPPEEFAWVGPLEAHWQQIRAELDAILADLDRVPAFEQVSSAQLVITDDRRWKTFFLLVWGHRIEENCARCPRTAELLDEIPGLETAMFSILPPGKHIPEHEGYYTGVLRYHLGLVIPRDGARCRIRVGTTTRSWELGRSLIFDDTFPHEVWNDTDERRVVLFLDVRRQVPFPLSTWVWLLMRLLARTPLAREGADNARQWATRPDHTS